MTNAIRHMVYGLLRNFHFSRKDLIPDRTRERLVFLFGCCLWNKNLNLSARDSQYRNHWNAPGVGWLVRDVVFLDLLDLAGAPRHAHRRRVQEHHRYVFRDAGNACHRACEQSIWSTGRYTVISACRDTGYTKTAVSFDYESVDQSNRILP